MKFARNRFSSVIGHWSLAISSLVIGHWSLVISAPRAEAGLLSRLISQNMEISLGLSVVASFDDEYRPYTDETQNRRLQTISDRLLQVVDRKDLPWSVKALDSDEVNAFALPGGQARVFRGLMEKTTDDELAYVLGHEFGHVDMRHGARMISKSIATDVLMLVINQGYRPPILQQLATELVLLGYSREYEDEADYRGVRYLFLAGFPLDGGVSLMRKFEAMDPGQRGIFRYFATHPNPADRIEAIERHHIPAVFLEFGDRRPLPDAPRVLVLPLTIVGRDSAEWAHFFPDRLAARMGHCGLARVEPFDPASAGIGLRWRSRWLRKAREMGGDFIVAPKAVEFVTDLRQTPGKAQETHLVVAGNLVADLVRVEDGRQVATFTARMTPADVVYRQTPDWVRSHEATEIRPRVEESLGDAVELTALDMAAYFYPRWAEELGRAQAASRAKGSLSAEGEKGIEQPAAQPDR